MQFHLTHCEPNSQPARFTVRGQLVIPVSLDVDASGKEILVRFSASPDLEASALTEALETNLAAALAALNPQPGNEQAAFSSLEFIDFRVRPVSPAS